MLTIFGRNGAGSDTQALTKNCPESVMKSTIFCCLVYDVFLPGMLSVSAAASPSSVEVLANVSAIVLTLQSDSA